MVSRLLLAMSTSRPAPRHVARVDLGPDLASLRLAAKAQGQTTSSVVRDLVRAWLARESESEGVAAGRSSPSGKMVEPTRRSAAVAVRGRVDGATERVEFALTTSEHALALQMAQMDGFTLNRWVAALVRARLTSGAVLGSAERDALSEASAQLGAVGRNLNQIARTLNAEGVGPDRYPDRAMLDELTARVDSQVQGIRQVLEDNRQRWTLREAS